MQVVCNSDLRAAQSARESALKARWNEEPPEVEALLHRGRCQRAAAQLRCAPCRRIRSSSTARPAWSSWPTGRRPASAAPPNPPLRTITRSFGRTPRRRGWRRGVGAWVEEEFAARWDAAYPLPDAIVEEIGRITRRVEVRVGEVAPGELPAALAEVTIYRGGDQLATRRSSLSTARPSAAVVGRRGRPGQDALAGDVRAGLARRRSDPHPLPGHAHLAVAGRAARQARHPQRGLVLGEEAVD